MTLVGKDLIYKKSSCSAKLAPNQAFSLKECVTEKKISYFSTKTNVVGAQNDLLYEKVLLGTQTIC